VKLESRCTVFASPSAHCPDAYGSEVEHWQISADWGKGAMHNASHLKLKSAEPALRSCECDRLGNNVELMYQLRDVITTTAH